MSSGAIMQQAVSAAGMLERLGYAVHLWSVTSFTELGREAEACEQDNRNNPLEPERVPYIRKLFEKESGPVIAVTDYMKSLANGIARWMPTDYTALGTDGFGLSESRESLREHFGISDRQIARASLVALYRRGALGKVQLTEQLSELGAV